MTVVLIYTHKHTDILASNSHKLFTQILCRFNQNLLRKLTFERRAQVISIIRSMALSFAVVDLQTLLCLCSG